MMTTQQTYNTKKAALIAELKAVGAAGTVALRKESSNLFRERQQSTKTQRIDVRAFNQVIAIDTQQCIAQVEGMATYEAVVAETLKHGLMPAVVPELKSITVGGAITGVGIEATSFRYGLVHETVTELDVLLSSGEVVTCTPHNEHRDLFFGFPNSYGTLGYALRCSIKLIPVQPYVTVERTHYTDARAYFTALQECCDRETYDFIDGVVFGQKDMYLNAARFTNKAPYTSDYTYRHIYYRSIPRKPVDYLTVADYIWRWDTDWFWCSKNIGMEYVFVRLLMGRKRLTSKFYNRLRRLSAKYRITQILRRLSASKEAVIQDVEIPLQQSAAFLHFFQERIGITPVWICPIRPYDPSVRFSLYPMNEELYVNFGFWDYVRSDKEPGFYNRLVEDKVRELGGKKSLYSDSYYTPEVFWQLYNKSAYDRLKHAYDPQRRLLNLYDKCVKRQ